MHYVDVVVEFNPFEDGWEVVGLDESRVGDILNDKPFDTKGEAMIFLGEYVALTYPEVA